MLWEATSVSVCDTSTLQKLHRNISFNRESFNVIKEAHEGVMLKSCGR